MQRNEVWVIGEATNFLFVKMMTLAEYMQQIDTQAVVAHEEAHGSDKALN
jgi:hypothetical protein